MRALEGMKEAAAVLRDSGIEDSGKESELILTNCLGVERTGLYRDDPELTESQERELEGIIKRRLMREPIQYIVGHVNFYGVEVKVGPGVLIPRAETELLVDEVIKALCAQRSAVSGDGSGFFDLPKRAGGLRILDLCTGSGCLALSLAGRFSDAEVFGTDISERALTYARESSAVNGLRNVTFLKGSLFEPVQGMRFDVIVSNPPYIKRPDIVMLQPEIRLWEPVEALDGGEDGLDFYREILFFAPTFLRRDGLMVLELGDGEAEAVKMLAAAKGFTARVRRDFAGVERVITLRFSSPA